MRSKWTVPPVPPRPLVGLLVVLGVACQSYEPRPLDLESHRAAWQARDFGPRSVQAFLERLEARGESADATGFSAEDGLTLAEARLVARVYHPELRLARLAADKASVAAGEAGYWRDPEFTLEALRIADQVPDRWVLAPSLVFTLPLSGSRVAGRRLDEDRARVAVLRVREAEWTVESGLCAGWIRWSTALGRAETSAALASTLAELHAKLRRLVEAGEIARTEASLFTLQETRLRLEAERQRGVAARLEQELRGQMGLAPTAPVRLVPSMGEPRASSEPLEHPELARLRAGYEVAESALRLELRRALPDLTLGPAFESDGGQSRFGLLGGLPLPFLNANRRAIAEAYVERELARAIFETGYEQLIGRRASVAAAVAGLELLGRGLRDELVPQAAAQVEAALELMNLGEGQPLVLLESLLAAHRARIDLLEQREAELLARLELAFLTGLEAVR